MLPRLRLIELHVRPLAYCCATNEGATNEGGGGEGDGGGRMACGMPSRPQPALQLRKFAKAHEPPSSRARLGRARCARAVLAARAYRYRYEFPH